MKTTITKTIAAAALVVSFASASQAAVSNPFNPKPSELLINNQGGSVQTVQRKQRLRNGEWYQGAVQLAQYRGHMGIRRYGSYVCFHKPYGLGMNGHRYCNRIRSYRY